MWYGKNQTKISSSEKHRRLSEIITLKLPNSAINIGAGEGEKELYILLCRMMYNDLLFCLTAALVRVENAEHTASAD